MECNDDMGRLSYRKYIFLKHIEVDYLCIDVSQDLKNSQTEGMSTINIYGSDYIYIHSLGGRGHWLFITLVPKFYNNVFLFTGLTTMGTFIEL